MTNGPGPSGRQMLYFIGGFIISLMIFAFAIGSCVGGMK